MLQVKAIWKDGVGSVQNGTVLILSKICEKLKICASISTKPPKVSINYIKI